MSDQQTTELRPALQMRRWEERPEGPPCTCGRVGWDALAKCTSYRCAARGLAKIMLEPADG